VTIFTVRLLRLPFCEEIKYQPISLYSILFIKRSVFEDIDKLLAQQLSNPVQVIQCRVKPAEK
jgi:hypothetical protein